MKKISCSLFILVLFFWSLPAFALPSLQLDIGGGYYNLIGTSFYNPLYSNETIIAPGDTFTLYALMKESKKTSLGDTYTISMALINHMLSTSSANLGSFSFANQVFNVTEDMVFGNPGIASHGIFDTYYALYPFQFNSSDQVGIYNTQENTGQFDSYVSGTGLYYAAFSVDTTNLSDAVSIHFDLLNDNTTAPFSHDAESDPPGQVPEPAAFVLLGFGIMGLAVIGRKNRA